MSSRTKINYLILNLAIGTSLLLNGCNSDGYIENSGLQYVLNVGNAAAISDWTLHQVEEQKTYDGVIALEHIMRTYRESEQRAAAAGFLQVYQRAKSGWPNIIPGKTEFTSADPEEARRELIRIMRLSLIDLKAHAENNKTINNLSNEIQKLDSGLKDVPQQRSKGIFTPK